jgi:type II secretion system protein G
MNLYTRNRGFTLIELLVVIAIIGVLASVVLASLSTAQEKARDTSRVAQIKQVKTALELYYSDQGEYPPSASGVLLTTLDSELAPYIQPIPQDPAFGGSTIDDYLYVGINPGKDGAAPGYVIRMRFEDENRPSTDNAGRCRTGVNFGAWLGSGIPTCESL